MLCFLKVVFGNAKMQLAAAAVITVELFFFQTQGRRAVFYKIILALVAFVSQTPLSLTL